MKDIKSDILFRKDFFETPQVLFNFLINNVAWSDIIRVRKTARFGQPNFDSEQVDLYQPFFPVMEEISDLLVPIIGFKPNNCFLNYYENGKSKMGWHGDSTHFLQPDTGIAILSVGDTRIFQIRKRRCLSKD